MPCIPGFGLVHLQPIFSTKSMSSAKLCTTGNVSSTLTTLIRKELCGSYSSLLSCALGGHFRGSVAFLPDLAHALNLASQLENTCHETITV